MRAFIIAIALLPSAALAGQAKLDASLPFKLKAGTIREEAMNGDRYGLSLKRSGWERFWHLKKGP